MELNNLRCLISSPVRRRKLVQLLSESQVESLLNEYQELPKNFAIHLIDKSTINNNIDQFYSLTNSFFWVLIDDDSDNSYPEIYKTAIHQTAWDVITLHYERELLLVIDKCLNANNLFSEHKRTEYIQFERINKSLITLNVDSIYLFTNLNQDTLIYYKTENGSVKSEKIRESIAHLEIELAKYNFFRISDFFIVNSFYTDGIANL